MNTSQPPPFVCGLLVLTGGVLIVLCIGFLMDWPGFRSLWPWQDGKLSYLFVTSVLAAIGTPVLWMGLVGELAPIRAGSLDFSVTYLGLSLTLFFLPQAAEFVPMPLFLILAIDSLLLNILLYIWAKKIPFRDTRTVPKPLYWSFLLFTVLLLMAGIALITLQPHIFPWPLKPQTSIVFGWIYLGAAIYFLYGFLYPVWGNVCGQMLGFLAYDTILLVPYIKHFENVKPEHHLSLVIYTCLIIYSLLLAIYYLFIHPQTRFGFLMRS